MKFADSKGLSLIELLVAMSIGSIILMSVLNITAFSIGFSRDSSKRIELERDLLMLSDYFSKIIPNAGGLGLAIDAAVFAENSCVQRGDLPTCNGSDRLTILKPRIKPKCQVDSVSGTWLNFLAGSECCTSLTELDQQIVVLVKGTEHTQQIVEAIATNQCRIRVKTGVFSANDNYDTSTAPPLSYWDGATVIPVEVSTYYLDSGSDDLHGATYRIVNSQPVVSDVVIADRIIDFQISLGYDFDPLDGAILDTGNATDEWLYNAPLTAEIFGQGQFNLASKSSLRMIAVGIALGTPTREENLRDKVRVLDGPERLRPNWFLTYGVSKTSLRNTYFFQ